MTGFKSRRIALAAAVAGILAAGVAFAPAASAGNVAWSVSIGGPGFAVAAGQPGYWGSYRGYGYGYRAPYPGYGYGRYRPWYRPVPAPVVYGYAPPVVTYVAPAYVAPRRVYFPAPVARPPAVPYYYGYGH